MVRAGVAPVIYAVSTSVIETVNTPLFSLQKGTMSASVRSSPLVGFSFVFTAKPSGNSIGASSCWTRWYELLNAPSDRRLRAILARASLSLCLSVEDAGVSQGLKPGCSALVINKWELAPLY